MAAARCARRAPEEWAELISALHAYTDVKRTECIQAPPTTLPVAQGRAQACMQLFDTLSGCTKSADKIETKQQRPYAPLKP
jgi:hypothetical protein